MCCRISSGTSRGSIKSLGGKLEDFRTLNHRGHVHVEIVTLVSMTFQARNGLGVWLCERRSANKARMECYRCGAERHITPWRIRMETLVQRYMVGIEYSATTCTFHPYSYSETSTRYLRHLTAKDNAETLNREVA